MFYVTKILIFLLFKIISCNTKNNLPNSVFCIDLIPQMHINFTQVCFRYFMSENIPK